MESLEEGLFAICDINLIDFVNDKSLQSPDENIIVAYVPIWLLWKFLTNDEEDLEKEENNWDILNMDLATLLDREYRKNLWKQKIVCMLKNPNEFINTFGNISTAYLQIEKLSYEKFSKIKEFMIRFEVLLPASIIYDSHLYTMSKKLNIYLCSVLNLLDKKFVVVG